MRYSFCLLAAVCLAGAAAAAPADSSQATSAPGQPAAATDNSTPPAHPWKFGQRLRHLFAPDPPPSTSAATVAPKRQPPSPATPSTKLVPQPMSSPVPMAAVQQPSPLSAKDLEKVGHEQDYSWITGKLYHLQGDSRQWVIRYAGPNEVDQYSGGMILTGSAELAKFHEGDLVCLHGQVLHASPNPKVFPGATYQIKDINLIEHGER